MSDLASVAPMIAGAVFMGGMAHVIYTDLTTHRIRNWLIIALLVAYWPLAMIAEFSMGLIVASAGIGLLVFMTAFGCFAAGWVGGGDVKLAGVSVLWLGPDLAIIYLLWTAILGSLVALAILAARRLQVQRGEMAATLTTALPYGPGMALAAVILFPQSPWGL